MNKLVASSRNEIKIIKYIMNQINGFMSSVEAGIQPAISRLQLAVPDLMNLNIEESHINNFEKYIYSTATNPRSNVDQYSKDRYQSVQKSEIHKYHHASNKITSGTGLRGL